MSKFMWLGVAAGIGIATAGGVAAFSYRGEQRTVTSIERRCAPIGSR